MNKRSLITTLVLLILFSGALLFFGSYNKTSVAPLLKPLTGDLTISITPTPFPFEDMTVPYLRSRQYTSSLGPQKMYSQNASYTTYRTSYISDGLKVYGLLTVPKNGQQKNPAIVFVHGYIPPAIYKTTNNYSDYVDFLARNGFVVFKIDLRGHGDSEGEAGGAYYSSDYVIDTLNARAALASSSLVDPNKIGLWGHSMAGNVLLRAFVTRPEIPAVVIWAGAGYTYQDLVDYRITDNSYRPPLANAERARKRKELFDTYGEFKADSWFWKQVAPTNYLGDLKGALAIHHATDDDVVSVQYAYNIMKLLDATGVEHESYTYPSGGHNISGSSFSTAMQRTVEFFKKQL